jgi:hypothetical protein
MAARSFSVPRIAIASEICPLSRRAMASLIFGASALIEALGAGCVFSISEGTAGGGPAGANAAGRGLGTLACTGS